ncbi:MAG: cbb3-type cytochrome c oxidase subunit 3 [Gemmatimonadaceae bacterium]|nr:cbb3-type cytochrome c oxidase subunit 3 [Gemmatimonadaceae bacterium]
MSLTDVMSGAQLDAYAQVALVAFMLAFGLIVWRIFSRRNHETYRHAARMPLDDDQPQTPRAPHDDSET